MKKILVIDDDPAIVELIKYIVKLQGTYQIIGMRNSVQELGRIFAEQPDCIIINIRMPRLGSGQLVSRLREDARTANIPFIILTAMKREQDPLGEILLEIDEYLTKPFKPSALNAAIERILPSGE